MNKYFNISSVSFVLIQKATSIAACNTFFLHAHKSWEKRGVEGLTRQFTFLWVYKYIMTALSRFKGCVRYVGLKKLMYFLLLLEHRIISFQHLWWIETLPCHVLCRHLCQRQRDPRNWSHLSCYLDVVYKALSLVMTEFSLHRDSGCVSRLWLLKCRISLPHEKLGAGLRKSLSCVCTPSYRREKLHGEKCCSIAQRFAR